MALSKISEEIRRENARSTIGEVRLVDVKLVNNAEVLPVSNASLPLPTGATTAAKQDLLLTELEAKADLSETQPVSTASLPLPAGAATSSKQDTLLTELQAKADLSETQPVDIIASLPSGTNYVGRVRLTDTLTDVKYPANTFAINGASALTVIAAVSSVKHRIFKILITTDTTGTLTISDGFGAVYSVVTNGPIILDFGVVGRLQNTANTVITITNSAGGNVSAHGTYSIVAA